MTDLKDKPGYENPLVDESGAVKDSSKIPHPRESDIEQKKLDNFGVEPGGGENTKGSGDFAPSMNDVTASSINAVTNGKFLGKFNINITNKQKAGGAGLFVGLILLILGLISLGPLQFIHMSQLLSQFHFSKQSDLTDNRFRKMMRYIRNPDREDRTRLGILANKSADKLTAKLEEKGIKPKYDGRTGYSKGFEINLEKMKNDADFGRLVVDGDPDASYRNIANEFGGKYENGLLVPDGNDYYKDKKFTKLIVKAAGLEGKIFATKARRLNIRGGNAGLFHPIKKSVANKIDDIIAARKEKLKIKDAESTPLSADNKNTEENPSAEAEANKVTDAANETKESAKLGKLFLKNGTGFVLGAVGVTGFTCLFDSLANTIYDSQVTNVLTPLMNAGVEAVAIGNQVMSGDDIDLLTLGAYSTNLYSKDYGSWENAKSIQANLGNENRGTPQPAEAALNVNDNAALKFFEALRSASILGADSAVSTICHPISQGASAIGGIIVTVVTGGSTAGGKIAALGGQIARTAVGMAASGITMPMIEKAIAVEPINVLNYHGGQFGSLVDSGAFLAGNEAFLDSGGQLLTAEQSAEVAKNQQYTLRQEKKNRSIYDKYINPVKYDSAVAQLMDDQSYNPAKSFSSIPTTFFGSFSDSFKNLAGVFSPQIYAQNNTTGAATFDYGLPYAGFTQSQIDNPIVDNPEENAEYVIKNNLLNKPAQGTDNKTYKEMFAECNELAVEDDLSSKPLNEDKSIKYQSSSGSEGTVTDGIVGLTKDGKCGIPNDDDLLRLRFAIFDMQTAQAAACQLGDDEACTSLGLETTKSNEVCPDGTVVSGTGEAGKIYWPLEETNPNLGDDTHDLTASIGTPVHAVTDGTVVESKDLPGCDGRTCGDGMQSYGRQITIDHGGKLGTVNYAHFSKRMVEKGDKVVAGQVIGLSGEAGNARGPHLHIDNNGSAGAYAILKELGAEKPPKSTSGSTGSSCSTPAPVSSEGWAFPIKADPKKRVMSCFAEPVSSGKGAHPGIDFEAPLGTPVYADYDGVIMDNNKGIYGGSYNILEIDHGNGLYSVYEHLGKHDVKPGDRVTAGQQIAVTGTAELTHAWHLHYGITKDPKQAWYSSMGQGKLVNPLIYINDNKPFGRCKVTPKSQ